MPSTFSSNLRLELIGSGEQSGVWGQTTNNNLGDLIEQAISGATVLDVTLADITLTALNGVTDQARSAVLSITGTPGTTRVITIPNVSKTYTVKNRSDSTVNIKTASGSPFAVPTLSEAYIYCDANNVITGRIITDGANTITSNPAPFNSPAFTGVPTAPTAAAGTNTTQIATTAFVQTALPVGSIIMWYGSLANIPTGWVLCNGASGTPDLRDRFVVGAGTSYALGDTGGANTVTLDTTQIPSHTHTGTTASTNIDHTHNFSATTGATDLSHAHTGSGTTSNNNVDHTHSGTTAGANVDHTHTFSANTSTAGNHSHSVSDPGHVHSETYPTYAANGQGGGSTPAAALFSNPPPSKNSGSSQTGVSIVAAGDHAHSVSGTTSGFSTNHVHAFSTGGQSTAHTHTYSFTTSTFSGNHTHSVSGTSAGMNSNTTHAHTFTTNTTGGGAAHENRPPYLALYYIMRV